MKLLASLLIAIFLCLGALSTVTAYLPTLDSIDAALDADPKTSLTLAAVVAVKKDGEVKILLDPADSPRIDKNSIQKLRTAGVKRIQVREFSFWRWSLSWLFLISVIGIVVGGLLIKKQMKQDVAARVDAAREEGLSVEQCMEQVQGRLGELAREVLDEPDEERANVHITKALDDLGRGQLATVLDARPVLINRFGLSGYAEFMSLYSTLERRIHRAWSAAADAVHEEAVDCLAQAVQEARVVQDWLTART
jgi:hypothetical protein